MGSGAVGGDGGGGDRSAAAVRKSIGFYIISQRGRGNGSKD
ncbi:hypothetical protein [Leptolyngbya sp. KIOST-1]|nr:hypothetical protein [Leptolyngbya sp. KIOST-1]